MVLELKLDGKCEPIPKNKKYCKTLSLQKYKIDFLTQFVQ